MKVVFFTPSAHGGHPRYTKEVLEALCKQNVPGLSYSLLTSCDLDEEFSTRNYPVYKILPRLKEKELFSNKANWAISRLVHYPKREILFFLWLLKERPDIVHVQEISIYFGPIVIFLARKFLGIRFVFTNHNVVPHEYPVFLPKSVVDYFCGLLVRSCDGVIVHSKKLRSALSQRHKIDQTKITVAPHGVWSDFVPIKKRDWDQKINLLFYGNIRKNKGLHYLLDAMPFMGSDFKLTIAGCASDISYFNELIIPKIASLCSLGLTVNLRNEFIPEESVPLLFSQADFVILPYKDFQAQSGILFDAIKYEVPIISSASGALSETVLEYKIGHVFDSYEPEEMARSIKEAIGKKDDKFEYDFSLVKKHMSWTNHAQVLNELYLSYR